MEVMEMVFANLLHGSPRISMMNALDGAGLPLRVFPSQRPRNATVGSTLAARRAGRTQAISAASRNGIGTTARAKTSTAGHVEPNVDRRIARTVIPTNRPAT